MFQWHSYSTITSGACGTPAPYLKRMRVARSGASQRLTHASGLSAGSGACLQSRSALIEQRRLPLQALQLPGAEEA